MVEHASDAEPIDLRSDTVTSPDEDMLRAMLGAKVGDDGYGEDPTTNELEEHCADLFGLEAALFLPTGTMSNQIALRVHTRPGDEVITEETYHLNTYESAPTADLAGVSLNAVRTEDGVLRPEHITAAVDGKTRDPRYSQPVLVGLENTVNYRAGLVVGADDLAAVSGFARSRGMRVHLDGARLFNAVVATGTAPERYGAVCDTVSICFAKGLGAPFGSVLAGPADLIGEARYYRKSYGGALHQCGHLAAAALHALRHNVDQLADDHANAALLGGLLADARVAGVVVEDVPTNIVIIDVRATGVVASSVVASIEAEGVRALAISPHRIRFVTHRNVTKRQVEYAAEVVAGVLVDLGVPDGRT